MAFRNPIRSLAQLRDVAGIDTAADGEALAKDDATGKFTPKPAGELSGAVTNAGGVPKVQAGTLAARPTAAAFGAGLYVTTDAPVRLFRSDGSAWTQVDAAGTSASGARLRLDANQSIPHATSTAINWSTYIFDTDGYWNAGSPSRLTIPAGKGGKFLVMCTVKFAANAAGDRVVWGSLVTSATYQETRLPAMSGSSQQTLILVDVMSLTAGSQYEFAAYQSSGGALNILGSYLETFCSIIRLGA